MKIRNKKFRYFALALCIVGLGTLIGSLTLNESVMAHVTKARKQNIFASLSGFEPNAIVKYTIIEKKGEFPEAITGMATTDERGNLTLPMPDGLSEMQGSEIKYNFLIDENNQSLNIGLVHNTKDQTLSVEGSGTDKFTKIILESGENSIETRSDWAGSFEKNEITDLIDNDQNNGYKIAFFNATPAQDARTLTREPVINVQFSPGGGGPTGNRINVWNTGNCGDGPTPSYCVPALIAVQADGIIQNLVNPLQLMAEQLSYNALQQALVIGTFFDAKEQLEAQRDLQALNAEANRDYQPSEQLCQLTSFTKSLASTEQKIKNNTAAFNDIMSEYYYNREGGAASYPERSVIIEAKLEQYRTKYCDPMDNEGGLSFLCEHDQDVDISNSTFRAATDGVGASDQQRMNKDIDYFKTFDTQYTLNVDFTDTNLTEDEEDVIALAKNLYWPNTYRLRNARVIKELQTNFMDARNLLTFQNLAHNSFSRQVATKATAPAPTTPANAGWANMKTMMRDFGLSDDDITKMFGENPSYYAQMDILTKKIYQNPDFYTNLYDKPANVDRILAAMEAFQTMQQNDHYQTMLRQEMLSSALLQTEISPRLKLVQTQLK